MHDGLALVSELSEEDVCWFLETGDERQVLANTVIISEGSKPESIFLVLSGLVGIHISSVGNSCLATLGPGEILGEISFLEDIPASASVIAAENSQLLALARSDLESRIAQDPPFAARLYKAFARVSSKRLRFRVEKLSRTRHDQVFLERALPHRWKPIAGKLVAFKDLMLKLDREVLKNAVSILDDLTNEIPARFMDLVHVLNEEIGDKVPMSKTDWENGFRGNFSPIFCLREWGSECTQSLAAMPATISQSSGCIKTNLGVPAALVRCLIVLC